MRAGPADRVLMRSQALREIVGTTFAEGLRHGAGGAVTDMMLFAQQWEIEPADVRCPVTVWTGGDDRNVPVSAALRLCQELPQAENIHRADFGHLWITRNFHDVLVWLADQRQGQSEGVA